MTRIYYVPKRAKTKKKKKIKKTSGERGVESEYNRPD
jgi:hypothetical protein